MSHKQILLVFLVILLTSTNIQCKNSLSDPRLTIVNVYSALDSVSGEGGLIPEKPGTDAIINGPTRRFVTPKEETRKPPEPDEDYDHTPKKSLRKPKLPRRKSFEVPNDIKQRRKHLQPRRQNIEMGIKQQIDNFARRAGQTKRKYILGEFRTNGKMLRKFRNNTVETTSQIPYDITTEVNKENDVPAAENRAIMKPGESHTEDDSNLIRVKDIELFIPHTGKRKRVYVIQFPLIVHHGNHSDAL